MVTFFFDSLSPSDFQHFLHWAFLQSSVLTRLLAADQPRGSRSLLLLRAATRQGGLRAVHVSQTGLLATAGLRDPVPGLRSQVSHTHTTTFPASD